MIGETIPLSFHQFLLVSKKVAANQKRITLVLLQANLILAVGTIRTTEIL
jgi:hypothetical protein